MGDALADDAACEKGGHLCKRDGGLDGSGVCVADGGADACAGDEAGAEAAAGQGGGAAGGEGGGQVVGQVGGADDAVGMLMYMY